MSKPTGKGWIPAKEAAAKAARAHRKAEIRAAKRGKAPAPEYKEVKRPWWK